MKFLPYLIFYQWFNYSNKFNGKLGFIFSIFLDDCHFCTLSCVSFLEKIGFLYSVNLEISYWSFFYISSFVNDSSIVMNIIENWVFYSSRLFSFLMYPFDYCNFLPVVTFRQLWNSPRLVFAKRVNYDVNIRIMSVNS